MYGVELHVGELSFYTKDVVATGSVLKATIMKWVRDYSYLESCSLDYKEGYKFGDIKLHDDGFLDITDTVDIYFTGIPCEDVKQAFIELYHDGFIDIRYGKNNEFLTKVLRK